MIFENEAELKERVETLSGRKVYSSLKIMEDASDYMAIYSGCVLRVEGNDYFIAGDAKEGRFGLGDQPKFWVKLAFDLTDGSRKIIKLVFHEEFTARLGTFRIRCRRDPDKESAVLEAVAGDPRFMQGVTVRDPVGNNIRVIDFIRGGSFFNYVGTIEEPHEEYFHQTLPGIMSKLVESVEAMAFLHRSHLSHGDIRNDHIFVEAGTGQYRWIDFDYSVDFSDYDVWSMGNILTYAVAKGIVTCRTASEEGVEVDEDDALLFYRYRLANLRKVYPYIPAALNDLLMRFSVGTVDFFTDFEEMVLALRSAVDSTWGGRGRIQNSEFRIQNSE